ncbi:unnamed protein product [Closterium sp. NIES-54]
MSYHFPRRPRFPSSPSPLLVARTSRPCPCFPVTRASHNLPVTRSSPRHALVALPSARRPPILPSLSLPPTALPSPRRPPSGSSPRNAHLPLSQSPSLECWRQRTSRHARWGKADLRCGGPGECRVVQGKARHVVMWPAETLMSCGI